MCTLFSLSKYATAALDISEIVDAGSVVDRENGPPDTIVLFVGERPR